MLRNSSKHIMRAQITTPLLACARTKETRCARAFVDVRAQRVCLSDTARSKTFVPHTCGILECLCQKVCKQIKPTKSRQSSYLSSSARFRLLHIIRSEEELPVEVGLLDEIHVSDSDLAAGGAHTYHGEVLQQLTANGASACGERKLVMRVFHID